MPGLRKILESHKAEVIRLAKSHGACNVRVFGSVARGEDAAGSDIDILVDLESGRGCSISVAC